MNTAAIPEYRPACSQREAKACEVVTAALNDAGVDAVVQNVSQAMTSPVWIALIAAALRLIASALVASSLLSSAIFASIIALLLSIPGQAFARSRMLRLPPLASSTRNVVARVEAKAPTHQPPLIVAASLDSHPSAATSASWPSIASFFFGAVLVVAAFYGTRWLAAIVAVEAALTLARLARMELSHEVPDSTNALQCLIRTAEKLSEQAPDRTVWLVAVGAGTAHGGGLSHFLDTHPDVARAAWLVSLTSIRTDDPVAFGHRTWLPPHRTHPATIRAVSGAALEVGHPVDTATKSRPDPIAMLATTRNISAISLACGGQDSVEASAAVVDSLARTLL